MSRAKDFERVAELCGDQLQVIDTADGWPGIADLKLSSGLVRVAIHVGPVGRTHRGRDDVERRFQNPGSDRPVVSPEGTQPLLIGLWEGGSRPVLVGMEAGPRIGKTTRQSLFISLDALHRAAERGWADHHTTSEEHIVAFHPRLIGTYYEFRAAEGGPSELQFLQLLESAGFTDEADEAAAERARRAASRWIRDRRFGREVVAAYGGLCAMCGLDFGLVEGGHIYPVQAAGSPDQLWNGLALCSNHHTAFDRHLVWVDPASRSVMIHPKIRSEAGRNDACRQFVDLTQAWLSEPSESSVRPKTEMFQKRYDFFGEPYAWAAA